jgi:hypothetical protein
LGVIVCLLQIGKGFNRGVWNNLEIYARSLTKQWDDGACSGVQIALYVFAMSSIYKMYSAPAVYVVTGPLYLPNLVENGRKYVKYEVIGPNDVAVPTHFFKVILMEAKNGYAPRPHGPTACSPGSGSTPRGSCRSIAIPRPPACSQARQIEAYLLPHTPLPDNAPLAQFKVPLQQVWCGQVA